MPLYPDFKYDAWVRYLVITKPESEEHPLWGEDPVFINYSDKLGKQCNSSNSLKSTTAWRQTLKLNANKFELSEDEKDLMRNGKRVLREGEYDEILIQFHDEANHPGMITLRSKVMEFYADVCYDKIDNYVRNCQVCQKRMKDKPYTRRTKPNGESSPLKQKTIATTCTATTNVKQEQIQKAKPSALKCYPLRLHPGAEIKSTLQMFVERNELKSAFILSCVGSVRKCKLRLADSQSVLAIESNHEIVSLTGTLSAGGHLHASLSDEKGQVVGGHVLGDMEVYTTAEIIIGNMPAFKFLRQMDPNTTYDELVIDTIQKDGKTVSH